MPIFLIARGLNNRKGIDNTGDILEVFVGPEPPSGPGYELSDIIKISNVLSKKKIDEILNTKRPAVDLIDKKKYWQNPIDENWYEVKVNPKYPLNLSSLTVEDRAILSNDKSTALQQTAALGKINDNFTLYPENTETLKP